MKKAINWDEVRRRLAESELLLQKALTPDAERLNEMYRQRAQDFATRKAQAIQSIGLIPFLVFHLGNEQFGIELRAITQVAALPRITPVPEAPSEIRGVINLQGDLVAVADLSQLIGLPQSKSEIAGHVLVIRGRNESHSNKAADIPYSAGALGLAVNEVQQVRHYSPKAITELESGQANLPAKFLKGMTDDHLNLIDLEAVLAHPAIAGSS